MKTERKLGTIVITTEWQGNELLITILDGSKSIQTMYSGFSEEKAIEDFLMQLDIYTEDYLWINLKDPEKVSEDAYMSGSDFFERIGNTKYFRHSIRISEVSEKTLDWYIIHEADDDNGQPTQWSATLPDGKFLWIDKEDKGYALYDTPDPSARPLSVSATLNIAMRKGKEYISKFFSAMEKSEEQDDFLDNIDTAAIREKLENGEAEKEAGTLLKVVAQIVAES